MSAALRFRISAVAALAAAVIAMPAIPATPATPASPAAPVPAKAALPKPTDLDRARNAPVVRDNPAAAAKVDLKAWGLEQADMSVLDDEGLARKADLPNRLMQLMDASAADDPLAIYLLSVYKRSIGDAEGASTFLLRAHQLGVVRAISLVAIADFVQAETAEQQAAAYDDLRRAANTGNAFSIYLLSAAISNDDMRFHDAKTIARIRREEQHALFASAEAGFGPALLRGAKLYFSALDQGNTDPRVKKMAWKWLDWAVLQAVPGASEFASTRAAR